MSGENRLREYIGTAEGYRKLRLRASTFVRTRGEIDDLVSETVMRALSYEDSFEYQGKSPLAWLFTLMRNIRIDQYRRSKIRQVIGLDDCDDLLSSASPNPYWRLRFRDLLKAVKKMKRIDREALVIVMETEYGEREKKYSNLASGTIKSRICRARRNLNKMMDGGNDG